MGGPMLPAAQLFVFFFFFLFNGQLILTFHFKLMEIGWLIILSNSPTVI
jgi:hypothetical protein